jgi:hypothetical protein
VADTGGIKAGRAYVVLGVDVSPLKKGLDAAAGYLKAFGVSLAAAGATLSAAGGSLGAGLLEATNILRQESGELMRANQLTGINVERLGEMGYAATQLGGDLEDVTHGMAHMANFLREVRDGSRSAIDTLDRLGVSADELLNLDLESAYHRLGAATNGLTNSTERLIVARQILGRHGIGTLGVFGAGRERFNQLGAEGKASGQVMSKEDVAAGVMLNRQWAQMTGGLKALMIQIGVGLVPQWQLLLGLVKGGAEIVTRFIKSSRDLVPWLDRLAGALTIGGAAFVALGTGLGIAGLLLRQFMPLLSLIAAPISMAIGMIGTLSAAAWGMAASLAGAAWSGVTMAGGAFLSLIGFAWSAATGLASAMLSGALSVAGAAGSMVLSVFGMIGPALGFLAGIASTAWAGLMAFGGALIAAATAAAGGAGPIGIFKAFLAALGLIEGGTTASTGILGTAIAVLTGETTIAEAVTGAWLIPLVALAGILDVLAGAVFGAVLAIALFTGVLLPAGIALGLLAAGITMALLPALLALAAVAAISLAPMFLAAAAAAIVLAGVIVGGLYLSWLMVRRAAIATWDAITSAASAAWRWIAETAGATWAWITEKASAAWSYISDRASVLWNAIKSAAATAWDWIVETATGAWDSISEAATSAWETISDGCMGLVADMGSIWGSFSDAITSGNIEDALAVGWAAIKLGWAVLVAFLEETWLSWRNTVIDAADSIWTRLRILWHSGAFDLVNIWRGLGRAITTAWSAVTDFLRARWAEVLDFVTGGSSAAPIQAQAERSQRAAEQAQAEATAPFDAEAEQRALEERVRQRQRELDVARQTNADNIAAAQQELEIAQAQADLHSAVAAVDRERQRRRLEEQLAGQGGAGAGPTAGHAAAGSFNAFALSGMVGAGSAAEQTARNTEMSLEVLRRILGAVQAGAIFGA